MRQYAMTPSQVARALASGQPVPSSEIPFVYCDIRNTRHVRASDGIVVDSEFADSYGIGRRYRSLATLALHIGCPMVCGNPVEWFVREMRSLWEARKNLIRRKEQAWKDLIAIHVLTSGRS